MMKQEQKEMMPSNETTSADWNRAGRAGPDVLLQPLVGLTFDAAADKFRKAFATTTNDGTGLMPTEHEVLEFTAGALDELFARGLESLPVRSVEK